MKSPKPYSIGRTVIFVPNKHDVLAAQNGATELPAVIVRTWEDASYENDEVNLRVFTDGDNNPLWRTSIPYSDSKEPGSWHWPEIK